MDTTTTPIAQVKFPKAIAKAIAHHRRLSKRHAIAQRKAQRKIDAADKTYQALVDRARKALDKVERHRRAEVKLNADHEPARAESVRAICAACNGTPHSAAEVLAVANYQTI